jgi:hypothetical protein
MATGVFMKTFVALLLMTFTAAAMASDWVFFATAADKTTLIEVDKASIVYGPISKVWVRYTWKEASGKHGAGDMSLERTEFNCATREAKWVESIYHPKYGEASTEYGHGTWEPVVPDSIDDALLEAVCKRPAKKPAAQ